MYFYNLVYDILIVDVLMFMFDPQMFGGGGGGGIVCLR